LIELVAVIVVLAILAGVAMPTLNNVNDTRSGAAAKMLLRDMTFARQRAIATATVSWVVLNPATETWSILAENPASPGRANATVLTDMATGKPYITTIGTGDFAGAGISTAAFDGQPEVGFDWLGKPLNSTGGALSLSGSVVFTGGDAVTVQFRTGHVAHVP
jgi:type II secretory pathway pseudopilin PulG